VIEPSQMQQPMQHQHLDLDSQRMPLLRRLPPSRLHAHRQIPSHSRRTNAPSRKRQHIGRLSFSAKLPIQPGNRRIRSQQHRHPALQPHRRLRIRKKPRQPPHRRQPKITFISL
jgi:hypothetical protein